MKYKAQVKAPTTDTAAEFLTAREVARVLRVNYATVLKLLADGTFNAFRVGSQWRVERASLARFHPRK